MPELHPSPVLTLPCISLAGDMESALPLEKTTLNAQVTGPVVSVTVTQRFGNPLETPAELDYLFPLPQEAAITAFEIRIGGRTIHGDLQEAEAARAAYEDARTQKKRAGLLEQRRPNLFAVQLANVQPGETVHAVVRYQQRLSFEDGTYEFVFPMGITPKYTREGHPEEGKGVDAPLAKGGEKIGPVEINLSVDAGFPTGDPTSPSHPLEVTRLDDRRFQARLAGQHIPDRDFVLRYALQNANLGAAAWASGEPGKEVFLAVLMPPVMEAAEEEPQPREFVFVLDRSGSMSGQPIAQARNALRACLRSLNPGDSFRILLFDHQLEWFQIEPMVVRQETVEQADAFLAKVEGRGGTEILGAIDAALGLTPDPSRTRYVVFLTDGAVSAEARALESIRQKVGSARLFTFGIGPSVNRALISRMAVLGRGRSTFLQLNEDIEGAIIRFQDSVSFPVLSDLTLEWEGGKAWDIYPARLPDLYAGQPLEISGRLARSGSTHLTLRGKLGKQNAAVRITLPESVPNEPAIGRVWAKARIEDLLEKLEFEQGNAGQVRSEIISTALEHNLVTPYTSFVALDQEATSGGPPKVIHVAQPLPKGLYPQAFAPSPPVMHAQAMMPFATDTELRSNKRIGGEHRMMALPSAAPSISENRARRGGFITEKVEPVQEGSEAVLRLLARSQKVDGSWNGDVEQTAAALLAFVRAGNTTRSGLFRAQLRRAVRWLVEAEVRGFPAFARALALSELAAATGDAKDQAAAETTRQLLPSPSTPLESAAVGGKVTPPREIVTLDDLRLAAILNVTLPINKSLAGQNSDLVRNWSATLPKP